MLQILVIAKVKIPKVKKIKVDLQQNIIPVVYYVMKI